MMYNRVPLKKVKVSKIGTIHMNKVMHLKHDYVQPVILTEKTAFLPSTLMITRIAEIIARFKS